MSQSYMVLMLVLNYMMAKNEQNAKITSYNPDNLTDEIKQGGRKNSMLSFFEDHFPVSIVS